MPSLKELDDDRIYHDGLELERLREELVNANKTIDHLTRAHKVLVERIDQLLSVLRRLRAVTIDPTVQLEIDKVLRA